MEGSCSNSWQVVYINPSQHGWTGFLDGCSISWGPAFVSRSDVREVREVSHLALELALDGICLRELQGPNYKCNSITWTVPKSASLSLLISYFKVISYHIHSSWRIWMKAQLAPLQDAESLQWLRHLSWSNLSTRSWPISAGALLLIVWQPMLGPQPSSKPPISTWHASDLSYYRNVRSHETTSRSGWLGVKPPYSLILYGISACWRHCLNKVTWHLTSKLLNYIQTLLVLDTCSANACLIGGPTCAKYIWHLPEDRIPEGQADTKTSRKRAESVDSQLLCGSISYVISAYW